MFGFMPENLGANAAVMTSRAWRAIADTVPLAAGHHITGMQGQLGMRPSIRRRQLYAVPRLALGTRLEGLGARLYRGQSCAIGTEASTTRRSWPIGIASGETDTAFG